MNVAFYIDEMNLRGVAKSSYEYAINNQKILNNKSIIFYNLKNFRNLSEVIKKFKKEFKTIGVLNFKEILPLVDQILIDRGDLSREVPVEKILFIQRSIISYARMYETPVYVATNLLESMINHDSQRCCEYLAYGC